jgi:hypothetical protein
MGELLAFIASVAMQHCPTCHAVFVPAQTGIPFCSRECAVLDPRQAIAKLVQPQPDPLKPPPLPWDSDDARK